MELCLTAPHAPRGGPSLTACPDFASNGSYVCASRGRSRKEEENDNNHNSYLNHANNHNIIHHKNDNDYNNLHSIQRHIPRSKSSNTWNMPT
jgi:hypothetical protein